MLPDRPGTILVGGFNRETVVWLPVIDSDILPSLLSNIPVNEAIEDEGVIEGVEAVYKNFN